MHRLFRSRTEEIDLILDDIVHDVSNQVAQQAGLGVQITRLNAVPEKAPTNGGLWNQIPSVTAVFADLKGSTVLNADHSARNPAFAFTYFIRAMTVIPDQFGADYIDIQGDGIFGLFSGEGSSYRAAACAITMKPEVGRTVSVQFESDTNVGWDLTAGIGMDIGTLIVRRLGLRGKEQNEVWAGKPVNMAAKLSSEAESNRVIVSGRVFDLYERFSVLRRRALLWSCGCDSGVRGQGFDSPASKTEQLWNPAAAPVGLGLDFDEIFTLRSEWCEIHGSEFCEALVTGVRPT